MTTDSFLENVTFKQAIKTIYWKMTLLCLVNPRLNAPFDTKFNIMKDASKSLEEFIANYWNAGFQQ